MVLVLEQVVQVEEPHQLDSMPSNLVNGGWC